MKWAPVCLVKFLFNKSHFWIFLAWNIVLHNFSQFWTVFPTFGWDKLWKTGLSHFGREKQVLDGKNPTLLMLISGFLLICRLPVHCLDINQDMISWLWVIIIALEALNCERIQITAPPCGQPARSQPACTQSSGTRQRNGMLNPQNEITVPPWISSVLPDQNINKANLRDLKAATGLQSGNAQFGSKSVMFCTVWPWNLMDDLGKQ